MFTADHTYSGHNWEKLTQHVQTSLPQKPKIFSQICIAFLQSTQHFGHLEKKDELDSLNILEVIDTEKCGYLNTQKALL